MTPAPTDGDGGGGGGTYTCDVCGVEVTEHDHVAVMLPNPSGFGFTTAEGYLCDTHLEQAQRNVERALGGESLTVEFGEGRNPNSTPDREDSGGDGA